MIAEPFISGRSSVREIWLYRGKVNPRVWVIPYPMNSLGRLLEGVLESTVRISTSSPALDRNLSISLNRLAYPETCVKGVGSTIRQILRGGLRFRGGASFDLEDCRSSVVLVLVAVVGVVADEYVWGWKARQVAARMAIVTIVMDAEAFIATTKTRCARAVVVVVVGGGGEDDDSSSLWASLRCLERCSRLVMRRSSAGTYSVIFEARSRATSKFPWAAFSVATRYIVMLFTVFRTDGSPLER
mmetsp:Transcript_115822/g.236767  ORF Transcript_115822/g.236767 Transcript_115822/m.236767 type:complete len:243 (+) Transcript_115822:1871-2599(+)